MNWQTTYPTIATIQVASFDTLCTWCDQLPTPQTDVERTVHRRLRKQRDELAAVQLRRNHPDIADKLNALQDTLERLAGGRTFPKA